MIEHTRIKIQRIQAFFQDFSRVSVLGGVHKRADGTLLKGVKAPLEAKISAPSQDRC